MSSDTAGAVLPVCAKPPAHGESQNSYPIHNRKTSINCHRHSLESNSPKGLILSVRQRQQLLDQGR